MRHGYVKCWVASLVFALPLLLGAGVDPGTVTIEGRVAFKDSQPFSRALVTITELRGRLFMMPAVGQKVSVMADEDGAFTVRLFRVRGVLDISARGVKCSSALSSPIHLHRDDWRGKEIVHVKLVASRGYCPELANPCDVVERIQEVPLKPDLPATDKVFSMMRDEPHRYKECLVEMITDQTPIPYPVGFPIKSDDFVRGDLAFFLLSRLELLSYDEVLREAGLSIHEMESRGGFAYYEWVAKPGNRKLLQEVCRTKLSGTKLEPRLKE